MRIIYLITLLILIPFQAASADWFILASGTVDSGATPSVISNGDYVNDTFDDLDATNNSPYNASSGWTDNDNGSGVSDITTFDGVSVLSADSVANTNSDARRTAAFGTGAPGGNILTVTYRVYPVELGSGSTANANVQMAFDVLGGEECGLRLGSAGASDVTGVARGAINQSCTGSAIGCWQRWTFVCDNTAGASAVVCDVYLGEDLVLDDTDICANLSYAPGTFRFEAQTDATDRGSPYNANLDYILAGSALQ